MRSRGINGLVVRRLSVAGTATGDARRVARSPPQGLLERPPGGPPEWGKNAIYALIYIYIYI